MTAGIMLVEVGVDDVEDEELIIMEDDAAAAADRWGCCSKAVWSQREGVKTGGRDMIGEL